MSTYTGTNYKDLDKTTPTEGASGTMPELNDSIREIKTVVKNNNSITTIIIDTTLDATHSTVIINKATAIAVTLPTASTVASAAFIKEYYLKNIGAGVATVNGTVTLNGTSTASPTMAQWDEMRIWTDGTTWYGVKYSATPAANTIPVRDANKDIAGGPGVIGEASATHATAPSISFGDVKAGDRIFIIGTLDLSIGTSPSYQNLTTRISASGTATVVFGNNLTNFDYNYYGSPSGSQHIYPSGSSVLQVTADGSLSISSGNVSGSTMTGSGTVISSYQLYAFFLKKQ